MRNAQIVVHVYVVVSSCLPERNDEIVAECEEVRTDVGRLFVMDGQAPPLIDEKIPAM